MVGQLAFIGPTELILLGVVGGIGCLVLYGLYRLVYRMGKAEGALQERERPK